MCVATIVSVPVRYWSDVFQSLAGFLVRCDSLAAITEMQYWEFQSLAGFLVRCDGALAPSPYAI